MIRRALAAAAAALVLVACGGDSEGRYDAHVAQVRQAVEAGDRDAALASLEELGTSAFHAHAAGDVSDEELAELAVLLEQARTQVDEELPPAAAAPTTTTPPPPPAPVAEASDEGGDEQEDKGKKKGRGRGGDDGGDDDDD